jgi:solute carrier family 50 protein (sugar transporter)
MSSSSTWATKIFCPTLGVILANGMWFSPWKAVWTARKTRNIGSLNAVPFGFTFINCIGWVIYGCVKNDYFVFFANFGGAVLGLFYSLTSLSIISKKKEEEVSSDVYVIVESLLLFGVFFWSIVGFLSIACFNSYSSPTTEAVNMIGYLASAFAIAYYGAPLSTMLEIIKKKDSSSLYTPSICVNLLNATLWTMYGWIGVQDLNLTIPNGIGMVLAVSQLLLILVFHKKKYTDVIVEETSSTKDENEDKIDEKILHSMSKSKSEKKMKTESLLKLSTVRSDDANDDQQESKNYETELESGVWTRINVVGDKMVRKNIPEKIASKLLGKTEKKSFSEIIGEEEP